MAKKEYINEELQEVANKSEENRLMVEHIEQLQISSKKKRNIVILNAITAGLFALSALLNLPKAMETGFEVGKNFSLYSYALCSALWGIIGKTNYNEKKTTDDNIEELTKTVLRTNK